MYSLYSRPGAGSAAVEALLAVCEVPYRTIDLERAPDGSLPEYFRRLNPKAEVPTLQLPDDSIMTESAAMMIYIADLHPAAGLAPAVTSRERAPYLRWMMFLATSVYGCDLRLFFPERFTTNEAETPGIKAKADAMMSRDFEIYAEALGDRLFMLGRFTALDLYAAMMVSWAPDLAALLEKHPNLSAMYKAVTDMPMVKAVWVRNGL